MMIDFDYFFAEDAKV